MFFKIFFMFSLSWVFDLHLCSNNLQKCGSIFLKIIRFDFCVEEKITTVGLEEISLFLKFFKFKNCFINSYLWAIIHQLFSESEILIINVIIMPTTPKLLEIVITLKFEKHTPRDHHTLPDLSVLFWFSKEAAGSKHQNNKMS